jgi:hypothetical protein
MIAHGGVSNLDWQVAPSGGPNYLVGRGSLGDGDDPAMGRSTLCGNQINEVKQIGAFRERRPLLNHQEDGPVERRRVAMALSHDFFKPPQ